MTVMLSHEGQRIADELSALLEAVDEALAQGAPQAALRQRAALGTRTHRRPPASQIRAAPLADQVHVARAPTAEARVRIADRAKIAVHVQIAARLVTARAAAAASAAAVAVVPLAAVLAVAPAVLVRMHEGVVETGAETGVEIEASREAIAASVRPRSAVAAPGTPAMAAAPLPGTASLASSTIRSPTSTCRDPSVRELRAGAGGRDATRAARAPLRAVRAAGGARAERGLSRRPAQGCARNRRRCARDRRRCARDGRRCAAR